MGKPILCVDFDGVIHSYTSGWQGADIISDPPVPGALRWLKEAMEHWDVQIYSSRSAQVGGVAMMVVWLLKYAAEEWNETYARKFVELLKFPTQKPSAFLTIDDRAICFQGDFKALDPVEMLKFKPWFKRDVE